MFDKFHIVIFTASCWLEGLWWNTTSHYENGHSLFYRWCRTLLVRFWPFFCHYCPAWTVSTENIQHSSVEYQWFSLNQSKTNTITPVIERPLAISNVGSGYQHIPFEIMQVWLKSFVFLHSHVTTLSKVLESHKKIPLSFHFSTLLSCPGVQSL